MPKIRILIYTPDIYNLQTRTASFPDQEKLLKKVDSGAICAFYEWQYEKPINGTLPMSNIWCDMQA